MTHKATLETSTISDGDRDTRKKSWNTSKGGAMSSATCHKRVSQPYGPKNSNRNARHGQENWRWTVTMVNNQLRCRPIYEGDNSLQWYNVVKRQKDKNSLEKWFVKGIRLTCRSIYRKSTQRNRHYSFYHTWKHTSRTHRHITAHRSWHAIIERGTDSSPTYCRRKSN